MKFWPLLLLLLVFSACQEEAISPCRSDFRSTAYVNIADFQDSLMLGDQLTVAMNFAPQDDRGKFLDLPPDFKYEWEISLKRLDIPFSGQTDTLTFDVAAEQGELLKVGPNEIRIRCARAGNKQQSKVSFKLKKAGLYSVEFVDGRSWVEFSQWEKCKAFLTFNVNVVQAKGLNPRADGYTLYVKP